MAEGRGGGPGPRGEGRTGEGKGPEGKDPRGDPHISETKDPTHNDAGTKEGHPKPQQDK